VIAAAAANKVRATKLAVSAPFHCALMQPAADGLLPVLAELRFSDPAVPVVTSVEARIVRGAHELPALLARQVTAPVRWEDTARALAGFGAGVAIECGPGRTLAGLMKRIVPELPCIPGGDVDGVGAVRKALG
jgi:[acyl-carrier-protein] S-malonyltransferase